MTTSKWIIKDWAGNVAFNGEVFASFGEARGAIDEEASVMFETEEEQNAYCEDMYAVNIDENGNELPDNGQYTA